MDPGRREGFSPQKVAVEEGQERWEMWGAASETSSKPGTNGAMMLNYLKREIRIDGSEFRATGSENESSGVSLVVQ